MKNRRCALVAAVIVAVCAVAFLRWNGPSDGTEKSVSAEEPLASVQPAASAVAAVSPTPVQPSSNQTATVRGTKPYVLTCEGGFDKPLRLAAEASGVRTVGVLSPCALLVEADAAAIARVRADRRFTVEREFRPSEKIEPALAARIAAGADAVEVSVVTLSPDDHRRVQDRVVARGGEILTGCFNEGTTFKARMSAALVSELASFGDVRWMEVFVRPQIMNDVAVTNLAMNVQEAWNVLGLSGANQFVSTSDTGIDLTHLDLVDQVVDHKVVDGCDDHDAVGHGTHTAGSIAGSGTLSDGQIRGTAYGAKLYAWFCSGGGGLNMPKTMAELFRGNAEGTEWDAYIHSASWGSPGSGEYDTRCTDLDKYVWEHPDFLPVFSAGNEGVDRATWKTVPRSIGSPAAAKNVLTVGATANVRTKPEQMVNGHVLTNGDPSVTAEYSSRGPCSDGRIKPDIAAPGTGVLSTRAYDKEYSYGVYEANTNYAYDTGTSMACPLTAGAVALVREWLMKPEQGFTEDEPPTAALMKAIVTGGAKGVLQPDNDQGWGRVDLMETLAPSNRAVRLIDRIPFAAKEEFTWLVTTTNDAPLDVQLAWIDHPGMVGGSQAAPKLVNDLDLTVRPYEDETVLHYGNGGDKADTLNNLESVRLSGSGTGTNAYLVTVSCSRVLFDHEDGGAAALYIRGAFDPDEIREYATVRIGSHHFANLDRALAAAHDKEVFPDPVLVEILDATALKESQTIDFDCTIVATNLDAYASVVTRRRDAALNVATNGFLSLGNVVFAGSSEAAVDVASNGVVAVSGLVDFGVPYDVTAVRTASSDGLRMVGPLVRGFTLDCAVATDEGDVFGSGRTLSVPVFTGITNTADLIVNAYDPLGEVRGYVVGGPDDYTLVWRRRPVPFEESVGYFVDADGKTNTAARIDRLIEGYRQARDAGRLGDVRRIVLRRSGTLSQPLSVGEDLVLAGEDGIGLSVGRSAGFVLTSGTLEVTGIAFSNYTGNALFLVNGADAKLKIGAGTAFSDINGTNVWSGAVTVLKGTATVGGGAYFERCGTKSFVNANGGAIYLASGCSLSLEGCAIRNCQTRTHGGAVYADAGSLVSVSGELRIAGNTVSDQEEDIYLKSDARLLLTGSVSGSVGIRRSVTGGNAVKFQFADAEEALYAHASKDAFFCTVDPDVVAEAVDSPVTGLVWADKSSDPQPWTGDPSKANARVKYPGQTPINYLLVSEALESLTGDATVEIIGADGNEFKSDIEVGYKVTLSSTNENFTLDRRGDCSIRIVKGGALTLKDVTVQGWWEYLFWENGAQTSVPLFDVCGGSLILATPSDGRKTEISRVYGGFRRNAGAVSVWQGGMFRIESGALIYDCTNDYLDDGSGAGRGGGVLVDDGRAELFGGKIEHCFANHGGGVFIGNGAQVEVGGDMVIDGNYRWMPAGAVGSKPPSNLYVYDQGTMVLTGKLTGHIGFSEGVAADTNVFGRIASSVPSVDRQTSAHNFTHDTNGDIGLAVDDGAGNGLLVWGSSLAADGTYVDKDGKTYRLLNGEKAKIDVPQAIGWLIYDGKAKTGVKGSVDCLITGNVATNAGNYVARATLRPGFVWADGTTDPVDIPWSIAKATYDMSGVTFENASFPYDGLVHELTISGTLPDGVTVSYSDNALKEIGSVEATATFTGDSGNYKEIDPKTATLTVFDSGLVDPPVPPSSEPQWEVVTNHPTPIAFRSITRGASDTEWELVVTNRVRYCDYRLIWTDDLTKGFVSTGDWEHVVHEDCAVWTTNVTTTGGAWFWRAEGADGTNMVLKVEE